MTFLTDLLAFGIDEANFKIRREQVRARVAMLPTMVGSQMLLAPLLVWLMWGAVGHGVLLGWLALIYAIHIIELFHWHRYRTLADDIQSCRHWDKFFKLQTAIAALGWSLGWILMYVPGDVGYQALLICVAMGMSAGAVAMNPVYRPSLFIYLLLLLSPLIVRVAMESDRTHWILAAMLVIYVGLLLDAAIKLMRTFELSLAQRFENEDLLHALHAREKEAMEALNRAEQANKAKSKFLAAASHDLRQPLQALQLFSDTLQDTAKEESTVRLAGQVGKSVNALVDMFNELLDVSRLDAGIVEPRMQHFMLAPLLDRLYGDFAPQAQSKGLDFRLPVCGVECQAKKGCSVTVYSDPILLERVLRNLIANAIRYTGSGSVEVRLDCMQDKIRIDIADTGIGIDAETLPHIFEEYFQVANPHRDRRKGLGLGLAIVRRIESLLGLNVRVSSVPGAGSVFGFEVPIGDAAQVVQPFTVAQAEYDLGGKVVALVEDDQDIREHSVEIMEQWGCRVVAGEYAEEVMHKLSDAELRPDLLVCDYRLPQGMTAIHVIKRMRGLWGSNLPVVVLTGDTASETLHEIHASGAILLHKPIAPIRLRAMMYHALHGEG